MKLKKEYLSHNSGGESYLIPAAGAGFSGMVKGNKTLGAILDLLKEDTTGEKIVDELCERYDAPRDVIAGDVAKALAELRKIGAIDD